MGGLTESRAAFFVVGLSIGFVFCPVLQDSTTMTINCRIPQFISDWLFQANVPNYKLIYFDSPGRAEVSRMLFHVAGVKFEDFRVKKEDWPKLKPTMPYGQVPVLDIDGVQLPQSNAIARFIARQHDLVGSSEWDAAVCDQIVDAVGDLMQHYKTIVYGKDARAKADAEDALFGTALPSFLGRMTERLEKRLTQGWLVTHKITWADVYVAHTVDVLETLRPGCLDKFPKMKAFRSRVYDQPKLKEYLTKRGPLPKP